MFTNPIGVSGAFLEEFQQLIAHKVETPEPTSKDVVEDFILPATAGKQSAFSEMYELVALRVTLRLVCPQPATRDPARNPRPATLPATRDLRPCPQPTTLPATHEPARNPRPCPNCDRAARLTEMPSCHAGTRTVATRPAVHTSARQPSSCVTRGSTQRR